jgi:hypothetical protein
MSTIFSQGQWCYTGVLTADAASEPGSLEVGRWLTKSPFTKPFTPKSLIRLVVLAASANIFAWLSLDSRLALSWP